jgi:hypothetical protein
MNMRAATSVGMDSNSRQAAMVIRQPGIHTVRVYGILDYGAETGYLYISSTLIQD